MNLPSLAVGAFALGSVAACSATKSKEDDLARFAKDWCLTIRASQVIPVYPLTQDLQPSDVFLVHQTVDEQQKVWREKGFLALDNHFARLAPKGHAEKKVQREAARPAEAAPTPPPALEADSVSDVETIGKDATTKKERRASYVPVLEELGRRRYRRDRTHGQRRLARLVDVVARVIGVQSAAAPLAAGRSHLSRAADPGPSCSPRTDGPQSVPRRDVRSGVPGIHGCGQSVSRGD